VSSNVEAPFTRLHHVYAGAHGVVIGHGFLPALFACLNEVDTGDTAAVNGAQVHIVRDASTSDSGLVNGVDGVIHLAFEEHG